MWPFARIALGLALVFSGQKFPLIQASITEQSQKSASSDSAAIVTNVAKSNFVDTHSFDIKVAYFAIKGSEYDINGVNKKTGEPFTIAKTSSYTTNGNNNYSIGVENSSSETLHDNKPEYNYFDEHDLSLSHYDDDDNDVEESESESESITQYFNYSNTTISYTTSLIPTISSESSIMTSALTSSSSETSTSVGKNICEQYQSFSTEQLYKLFSTAAKDSSWASQDCDKDGFTNYAELQLWNKLLVKTETTWNPYVFNQIITRNVTKNVTRFVIERVAKNITVKELRNVVKLVTEDILVNVTRNVTVNVTRIVVVNVTENVKVQTVSIPFQASPADMAKFLSAGPNSPDVINAISASSGVDVSLIAGYEFVEETNRKREVGTTYSLRISFLLDAATLAESLENIAQNSQSGLSNLGIEAIVDIEAISAQEEIIEITREVKQEIVEQIVKEITEQILQTVTREVIVQELVDVIKTIYETVTRAIVEQVTVTDTEVTDITNGGKEIDTGTAMAFQMLAIVNLNTTNFNPLDNKCFLRCPSQNVKCADYQISTAEVQSNGGVVFFYAKANKFVAKAIDKKFAGCSVNVDKIIAIEMEPIDKSLGLKDRSWANANANIK